MATDHLAVYLNVVVHHQHLLAKPVWTELAAAALMISTVNASASAMSKEPVTVVGKKVVAVASFVLEPVMEVVPDPDSGLAIVLPVLVVVVTVTATATEIATVTVMAMTEELWAACFSCGL